MDARLRSWPAVALFSQHRSGRPGDEQISRFGIGLIRYPGQGHLFSSDLVGDEYAFLKNTGSIFKSLGPIIFKAQPMPRYLQPISRRNFLKRTALSAAAL